MPITRTRYVAISAIAITVLTASTVKFVLEMDEACKDVVIQENGKILRLEDYYEFTETKQGYTVRTNKEFEEAIVNESPYKDWEPGESLPKCTRTYGGRDVVPMASRFKDGKQLH